MRTEIDNYLFSDMYEVEEKYLDKDILSFKGRRYTFRDMQLSINWMCHKLIDMGVKKGDHVSILSMNSYNWLISFLSVVRVGGVAVLNNYILRHNDLVQAIKNSDSKFLLVGKYVAAGKDPDDLPKLLKDTGIPEENCMSIRGRDLSFKRFIYQYTPTPLPEIENRAEESRRTSHIIFTTGTTSVPKAVMLSQYGLMNIIYHGLNSFDSECSETFMCLLPMFHCFGLLVVIAYLSYKRLVFINEMANPIEIYKEFLKEKAGDYASVAIIFDKIARAPGFWIHHGKFVKHCIVGGGFTSEKGFKFLERKYGRNKFLNGYGQSECSPLISFVFPNTPPEKHRVSVGTIMPGLEIKIQDPVSKKDLTGQGIPGEILVKGYVVCNGYYKLPDDKQPFDSDGYLHTGDLGFIDKDGYLELTGRLKDIIVRKGENISPKEIEAAFEKYKEFSRVRVMGFPSLTDGEYIIAAVEIPNKKGHFHERIYLDDLHKVLPSLKIPEHIIYLESFPLNANGKLDERTLREICLDKLDRIVDHGLYKETSKILKKLNKEN